MTPSSSAPLGGPAVGSAPSSSQDGSRRPTAPSKPAKSKLSLRRKKRRKDNGGCGGGGGDGSRKRSRGEGGGGGGNSSGSSSVGKTTMAKASPSSDQRSSEPSSGVATSNSTATAADVTELDRRSGDGRISVDSATSSEPSEARRDRADKTAKSADVAAAVAADERSPSRIDAPSPSEESNKENAAGIGAAAEGSSSTSALAAAAAAAPSDRPPKASKRRRGGGIPIPSFSPVDPPASPAPRRRPCRSKDDGDGADGIERGGDGDDVQKNDSAAVVESAGSADEDEDGSSKGRHRDGDMPNDRPEGKPRASQSSSRYSSSNGCGNDRPKVELLERPAGGAVAAAAKSDAAASPAPLDSDGCHRQPTAFAVETVAGMNYGVAKDSDDDSLPSPVFGTKDPSEVARHSPVVEGSSRLAAAAESKPLIIVGRNAGLGTAKLEPLVIDIADSDSDNGEKRLPACEERTEGAEARKQSKTKSSENKRSQSSKRDGGKKTRRKKEAQMTKRKKDGIIEASPGDEEFAVPRSKRLADREKILDQGHSDLIRKLSKKRSPDKYDEEDDSRDAGSGGGGGGGAKRAKRSARRPCALCSTCSCSRGSALKGLEDGAKAEATNPLSGLARTDTEVERALIGRLSRLEKSAAWFDNLCYKVGRELKKHRTKVAKKRADASDAPAGDRPRFLADVNVADAHLGLPAQLNASLVKKAQHSLFSSFDKNFQPTLTQLMHGRGEGNGANELNAGDKDCTKEQINEPASQMSPNAQNETVSLEEDGVEPEEANDSYPVLDTHQIARDEEQRTVRTSSLSDLHKALSRGQVRRADGKIFGIGLWDAATTSTCEAFYDRVDEEGKCQQKSDLGKQAPGDDQLNSNVAEGLTICNDNWIDKVGEAATSLHENGLDHLLDLFQNPGEDQDSGEETSSAAGEDEDLEHIQSQLTQRGTRAVEILQRLVSTDPARLEAVEAACPNWQDNIRFSFLQTDEGSVKEGLENVRRSREKLEAAKEQITRALHQQEHVLELYETSLSESLRRFEDEPSKAGPLECIKEESLESSQMDPDPDDAAADDDGRDNNRSIVEIADDVLETD